MTSKPHTPLCLAGDGAYRRLVDAVTDVAIYLLDAEGRVASWNPGAQRFKGYTQSEIIGRHFSCFYTEEDRTAGLPERALGTATEKGVFENEGWRLRKDGTRFWAHVVIDPIRDDDGKLVGFAKITRDLSERKQSEDALRRSEAQFRLLVQSVSDCAIYMLDRDGRISNWNLGAQRIKGYLPHEIIGQHFSRFYTEADRQAGLPDQALAAAASQGSYRQEGWRVRKDGTRFWAHVAIDAIRGENGEVIGFAKVSRDVSREREREREIEELNASLEQQVAARTAQLQQLSALQRAILADAAVGIIATDVEGLITLVNPAAESMLGYRAEELVGKTEPGIFHDPDEIAARAKALSEELGRPVGANFEIFAAKASAGGTDLTEWTYIRKDGTRFPILMSVTALRNETDGTIFGYLGMAVDQESRRERERQLAESEARYRLLVEDQSEMVSLATTKGVLTFVNHAYARHFGCEPADLLGRNLFDYIPEEERAGVHEHLDRVCAADSPLTGENRLVSLDGTAFRWISWTNRALRDEKGEVLAIHSVGRDITENKQAQAQLEVMNANLAARSHEAEAAAVSKSQFLANMSHEIRSPMNAILGMLQLLLRTELSGRQEEYASKAFTATQSLLCLLNDILDFSKIEAGRIDLERTSFSIDHLMQDLAMLMRPSVGRKPVELVFSIDPALPDQVMGDMFRLRQVLLNLVGNAVKFTAAGEVLVSLRRPPGLETDGVEFAVRDTGIGIPEEQLATIFEDFRQAEASTTRRFGGTGLGLAISQRLVSLMGGNLAVASDYGRGSRFSFVVELAPSPQPRPERPRLPVSARCLLVVGGSEHGREAMTRTAEAAGGLAVCVESGWEALSMLRAYGERFDVVCVDERMPDLDGCQMTQSVRRLLPGDRPAVFLMSSQDSHGEGPVCQGTSDGFLTKPVLASQLVKAVAALAAKDEEAVLTRRGTVARLHGLKLLVVEDTTINQEVAKGLLADEGADVEIAANGYEAIERALSPAAGFDAILMDIQMPGIDGYETTRRLRATGRLDATPIIAMTANAMTSDKQACLDAGMNDHIAKPIDIENVVETVRRHCGLDRTAAVEKPRPVAERRSDEEILDPAAALLRLGGNRLLFVTVGRGFLRDIEPVAAQLAAACRAGDAAAAGAALHKMKGMGGLVGAKALAEAAGAGERAVGTIAAGDLTAAVGAAEIAALVERTVAVLGACLDAMAEPEDPASSASRRDSSLYRAEMENLLAELEPLLDEANMRACDHCAALQRLTEGDEAIRLQPLLQAVGRLDFLGARRELGRLKERPSIQREANSAPGGPAP